jgi:hypothetical protein
MKDEEDGRPGHVALQSGHTGANTGVHTVFLSLPHSNPKRTVILNNPLKIVILSERSESKDLRLLSFLSTQHRAFFLARTSRRPLAPPQVAAYPTAGGGEHHENVSGK